MPTHNSREGIDPSLDEQIQQNGETRDPQIRYSKGFKWLKESAKQRRAALDLIPDDYSGKKQAIEKTYKDFEYAESELNKGNPEPLRNVLLTCIESYLEAIKNRRMQKPVNTNLTPEGCIQRAEIIRGLLEILQQLDS